MAIELTSITAPLNDPIEQGIIQSDILLAQAVAGCLLLILALILMVYLPTQLLSATYKILGKVSKKRKGPYLWVFARENTIKSTIQMMILVLYLLMLIPILDLTFNTVMELPWFNPMEMFNLLWFFFIIVLFFLFINFPLDHILKQFFVAALKKKMKKYQVLKEVKALLLPMKIASYLFGIFVAFQVSGMHFQDPGSGGGRTIIIFFSAVTIVVGAWLLARIIIFALQLTTFSQTEMEPQVKSTVSRGIKYLVILFGVSLALAMMGVDYQTVAAFFAVIGFALVFGVQNTVADFMSGIILSFDRSFKVGDRIRVGQIGKETWGDVKEIGIRSTKIETTENESVVVPNHIIAQNEIWNFTKDSPKMALTMDIGISYDSDWRLAEKLMLEVVARHPYVLRSPRPHVVMDSFADFSVNLKLWVWIPEARDMYNIRSDILKAIKDAFDANGVEIPFPYRTSVEKRDLPQPRRMTPEEAKDFKDPRRYPSKGLDYFEFGSWLTKDGQHAGYQDSSVRILVPTAGGKQVRKTAEFVMKLAQNVDGSVTALYIVQSSTRKNIEIGVKALNEFNQAGTREGVMVATLIEEGDVIEKILETIEDKKISLVVMGASEKGLVSRWGRADVTSEILEQVDIPTVIMPHTPDEADLKQMLKNRYF